MKWDAYPVLPPVTTFPPIQLAKGLYYVNAFEP
jgi:prenylcysteine oxidase / farnesylcysteine lyase